MNRRNCILKSKKGHYEKKEVKYRISRALGNEKYDR